MIQKSLFERAPFPVSWFPNETLYSLICRFHRLSGSPTASKTANLLFAHHFKGVSHDFPCRLHKFYEATDGALGPPAQIALERTLIRFYRPFATEIARKVLDAMPTQAGLSSSKFSSGLLTTRLRSNHPLKACPSCMIQDGDQFGVAYWHLPHQCPGVWICTQHDEPLCELPLKSNGVRRFDLLLPDAGQFRPSPLLNASKLELSAARNLADFINQLMNRFCHLPICRNKLANSVRYELGQHGLLTATRRLRLAQASQSFASKNQRFATLPEAAAFPTKPESARAALTRLIGRPCAGAHPLRWVAILHWLFDTPDNLIQILVEPQSPPEQCPSRTVSKRAISYDHERLISLVATGKSVRSASTQVGIGIQAAMEILSARGMKVSRRPKKITLTVQKNLLNLAQEGLSRQQIARASNLSVTTVGRILREHPEIENQRLSVLFNNETQRQRNYWHAYQADNTSLSIKQLRLGRKATYAWLYRNDRQWLIDQLKKAPRHPRGHSRTCVNWKSRDQSAAALVQKAALSAIDLNKSFDLTLLRELEPDIVPHLSNLARLPQTKIALERALNSMVKNTRSRA